MNGQWQSDERSKGDSAAGNHSPPWQVCVVVDAFKQSLSSVDDSIGQITAQMPAEGWKTAPVDGWKSAEQYHMSD